MMGLNCNGSDGIEGDVVVGVTKGAMGGLDGVVDGDGDGGEDDGGMSVLLPALTDLLQEVMMIHPLRHSHQHNWY